MFEATKEGKLFVVRGTIAIARGRVANASYTRYFRTRAEAERDARQMERINADAVESYEQDRKARLHWVREYLAERALRQPADANQMVFAF